MEKQINKSFAIEEKLDQLEDFLFKVASVLLMFVLVCMICGIAFTLVALIIWALLVFVGVV